MEQIDLYLLKQAIREVLLSEEFLKAFAAAWMNVPLLNVDELNLRIEPHEGESK